MKEASQFKVFMIIGVIIILFGSALITSALLVVPSSDTDNGDDDNGNGNDAGILILRPDGDISVMSAPVGDSPNYACIDDGISDENATYTRGYISPSSPYTRDYYTLSGHTTEAGTINSVTGYIRGRKEDSSTNSVTSLSLSDGGGPGSYYSFVGQWRPGNLIFSTNSGSRTINPRTGVAYTWAEIDDMTAYVILTSWGGHGYYRVTQVYVIVDYNPAIVL